MKRTYEQVGELTSIFERGGKWQLYYRHNGRPIRQALNTTSKKEARRKAFAVERDLVNGEQRRAGKPPLISDVIVEYISHLRAQGRAKKTIRKYEFAFKLALELAERRGISRIDQIDLAFIDAFRLAREVHRAKPKTK